MVDVRKDCVHEMTFEQKLVCLKYLSSDVIHMLKGQNLLLFFVYELHPLSKVKNIKTYP